MRASNSSLVTLAGAPSIVLPLGAAGAASTCVDRTMSSFATHLKMRPGAGREQIVAPDMWILNVEIKRQHRMRAIRHSQARDGPRLLSARSGQAGQARGDAGGVKAVSHRGTAARIEATLEAQKLCADFNLRSRFRIDAKRVSRRLLAHLRASVLRAVGRGWKCRWYEMHPKAQDRHCRGYW